MRCGFQPRGHDRTDKRMEGIWMGFGPLLRGVGLQHTRGLYGSPVNRWSIKQTPNGTKLDRRSMVVYQGRLANLSPFRASLIPAHEKRQKGAPEDIGVSDCKTDNGENARMH